MYDTTTVLETFVVRLRRDMLGYPFSYKARIAIISAHEHIVLAGKYLLGALNRNSTSNPLYFKSATLTRPLYLCVLRDAPPRAIEWHGGVLNFVLPLHSTPSTDPFLSNEL